MFKISSVLMYFKEYLDSIQIMISIREKTDVKDISTYNHSFMPGLNECAVIHKTKIIFNKSNSFTNNLS